MQLSLSSLQPNRPAPSTIKLRPYQNEADEAIDRKFDEGAKSLLLVLPTGAGKTVTFAYRCNKRIALGERLIIIVHRDELIRQAARKVEEVCGIRPGIEKAEERSSASDQVVIGSVQTLIRRKFLPGDPFDEAIIDEAHHATEDNSYGKVLANLNPRRTLGVTATPWRSDKIKLSSVFEDTAYSLSLMDLINQEFLVDIKVKSLPVQVDLSNVHTKGGDFAEGEVGEALEPHLDALADIVARNYADRKMLSFCPLRDTSRLWTQKLVQRGLPAEHVDGESPDRKEILARFKNDETRFLSNASLLIEGYDEPSIDTIFVLRPTRSRVLFSQCLDEKTEVLTKRGFVGVNDISQYDEVAAFDRSSEVVSWEKIISITDRPLADGEEMFSLQSPTIDLRVTGGHNMVYRTRRGRKKLRSEWMLEAADQVARENNHYEIPVAGLQDACGISISDDEIRFAAWIASDGGIAKITNTARIYQAANSPYIKEIESCLVSCGLKYGMYSRSDKSNFKRNSPLNVYTVSKGAPRGRDKHLSGWGHLEPYVGKEFPAALENMDKRQLGIFLEVLHMADGAKQLGQYWTRRTYHIAKGNKVFMERLQSICVRRGFRANLATTIEEGKNPLYVLHVKDEATRAVGANGSKDRPYLQKTAAAPRERVWCVENRLGTLIVRRNGKIAIVGNCIGRGTRLFPGKKELLVLDPVFISERHNIISVADLDAEDDKHAKAVKRIMEKGKSLQEATEEERIMRREALAEALRKNAHRSAYEKKLAELSYALDIQALEDWEPVYRWHKETVSDKQRAVLEKAGVDMSVVQNKGMASVLLDGMAKRREGGLATLKQVRFLAKLGHPAPDKVLFVDAGREIDRLQAQRGWKPRTVQAGGVAA